MKNYDFIILNYLIDRYENSSYFKSNFKSPPRKIYLEISKLFSDYGNSNHYLETEKIEDILAKLFKKNYLLQGRKTDFGNQEVLLNMDDEIITDIYNYLDRKPKPDNKMKILERINLIKQDSVFFDFITYIKDQIDDNKSLNPYIENNSYEDFIKVISILEKMEIQNDEISFRKFSVSVFQDSKKLELYKRKIFNIVKDFYDNSIETDYQAFSLFHIYRNPLQMYIKGNAVFKINNQIIDLNNFNDGFVFASKDINDLEILEINVKKVITIENLTSFYDFNDKDTLVLYLGGFHNSLSRNFLVQVYNILKKEAKFYHFGDIDAGGFHIYLDLVNKTKIPFETYKMDISTLEKYIIYTSPLTQNDIKRLTLLKNVYQNPILDFMLLHNVKLEQEIID